MSPWVTKERNMTLAADYPFLEVFWTMLIFFGFVIWLWILFAVLGDILRRHDASGWIKVLWIVFVVVLPFLGVFVYLIAEHGGMTERAIERERAAQKQSDEYVRSVARSSPAEQIAQAKQLLDGGTITQAEFDQVKEQALAG
jgi:Phospholipase_D-nuclease N-terminal